MFKDKAFLIVSGALFKLNLAATDLASSFQVFIELTLSVTTLFGLFDSSLSGYWFMFWLFQASTSFICAASWLSEGKLKVSCFNFSILLILLLWKSFKVVLMIYWKLFGVSSISTIVKIFNFSKVKQVHQNRWTNS